MNQMRFTFFTLLLCLPSLFFAQSTKQLEYELELAENDRDRLIIGYKIAKAYLDKGNWKMAEMHGSKTHKLAIKMGQEVAAAQTAEFTALAFEGRATKDRKNKTKWIRQAESWHKTALSYAKKGGNKELVIQITSELAKQAAKGKDFRKAYRYLSDGYDYFKLKVQTDGQEAMSDLKTTLILQEQINQLIEERDSLRNVIWELEGN